MSGVTMYNLAGIEGLLAELTSMNAGVEGTAAAGKATYLQITSEGFTGQAGEGAAEFNTMMDGLFTDYNEHIMQAVHNIQQCADDTVAADAAGAGAFV